MALQNDQNASSLLDSLYCEEERWDDEVGFIEESVILSEVDDDDVEVQKPLLFPLLLLEQDLFWEDEEIGALFSKEQEQQKSQLHLGEDLLMARKEAVEWILKVIAHYGFSTLTTILAINYLDRFLSSVHFQREKPWMIQLVAVTCLSLAAKVEETQVPLLLDLQVEEAKYAFEAKAIQRMELLLLSTLKWKMHPVTPISFLDHITRRLGLKSQIHWEFYRRCEQLLLCVVADSRFVGHLPSVLATATMMHVIDKVEPSDARAYQNQLLGVLKISKQKVSDCYKLILESTKTHFSERSNGHKRKYGAIPGSPSGVIDVSFSCDDSSSVSSSPEPLVKKSRTQKQQMPLTSLSRVFVNVVESPR